MKVLVLGAGFGGVRAALDLSGKNDITIVNDSPYHCFHADLYEVVATKLKHEDKLSFENLISTVNIPLSEIFKNKQVKVLIDKVDSIDSEKKSVKCAGQTLEYDRLICALGSVTNYFNIPGAEDFSHPFKSAEDALNTHNDLEELMRNKSSIKVAIGGGGFTGVELAGNLADFLRAEDKVIVVEADNLLGGMPDWAKKKALDRLKNLGVEVYLNSPIKEVKEDEIICENKKISFDYLLWTAGVKGSDILPKDTKDTQTFVIGDQSSHELKVPAAAWVAIDEAKLAAQGIAPSEYKLQSPSFVVPIGRGYALSNVFGIKLTGFFGWVLKRLIALKYFSSILPLPKAFSIWYKGISIYE